MEDIHIITVNSNEDALSQRTYFQGIGYQVEVYGPANNLTIDARSVDGSRFVVGEDVLVLVATK